MRRFIATILFISILGPSFGQKADNYLEGYVVLLNGDTLTGRVMDRDESTFGGLIRKVRFKPEKGWKKKYLPGEIRYYKRGPSLFKSIWLSTESRLLNQKYYSQQGVGEQVFVQVIHQGTVALYHWEYMDEDNSTIEFIPLLKRADSHELVRATQGIFGLKRKRLAEYFIDCPTLTSAILTKEFKTVEELIKIYEEYCNDAKSTSY